METQSDRNRPEIGVASSQFRARRAINYVLPEFSAWICDKGGLSSRGRRFDLGISGRRRVAAFFCPRR